MKAGTSGTIPGINGGREWMAVSAIDLQIRQIQEQIQALRQKAKGQSPQPDAFEEKLREADRQARDTSKPTES